MYRIGAQLRAIEVLQRRGMIDLSRPADMVRASRAVRRYGTFGGLATYTAARYGNAPAVTDERGTLSFRELEEHSNALARALNVRGVGMASVVGLLSRNDRSFLLALMAANKLGAQSVPLNTGFGGPQLVDVCQRERISTVLADGEFLAVLRDLPDDIARILNAGTDGGEHLPTVDELVAHQSIAPLPAPPRAGGLVLLTSGTTGTPKGAPRDRIAPLHSAQLLDRVPWPPRSVYVDAAPLFHATGLATCALGLALGNRIVMARRFDAAATLSLITEYRCSTVILVPTMLRRMLDVRSANVGQFDTRSLKVVFVAGSVLTPDLCARTADAFGDVLYNLYGSTEVATATVATPLELRRAPGTVGRPPIGCTIAAYDDANRLITEPGQVGTLYVSSGLSFTGYTDGAGKNVVDGLLSSGDVGHFDEDGLWFVDGRDDDMVVSGGENVFPLEVENVLCGHPGIVEAAVIGVDDEEFGQRLRAYVVNHPDGGPDADDIKMYVRGQLARYKVPREVVFVDALPRNETGKVIKRQLAQIDPL
jgi:fatty-acyl-CoA synthase